MAKPSPKPAEILPRAKEPAAKTPAYVLQVGSFRRLEDADSLKAKLALIGLNAKIQSVPVNSEETWHRVRLGPYKDSSALQEARKRLQSNGMQAIVLK
jgi:cell division protein FtsN